MNRVIDDPEEVAEDFIRGVLLSRPDLLAATDDPRVVRRSGDVEPRVGVVTGGGSGHEPAFVGYVGPGLVDAVAIGEIFASPTAKSFYAASRAADQGHGVACHYGNYAGDNMKVAAEGLEATRDMVARFGRATRLGERSRGHLDAGAASAELLLRTHADGLQARLEDAP